MVLESLLILSVLLQFAAFFITISLIPKTRFSIAWISISIGFLLMSLRRLYEAFIIFNEGNISKISLINSLIAVIVSVAMFISSIYIRRIFEVMNRIMKLRKENETKVLSAMIKTEEKERRRFAKELHDGLGPVLSAAKMTISAIEKNEINNRNIILLEKAEHLVDDALSTTKGISYLLTPLLLEKFGVKKALEAFVENTTPDSKIKIEFAVDFDNIRFKEEIEVIIYRICCEFINNSLKYAQANKIRLLIMNKIKSIHLIYEDNGRGFDISSHEMKGLGLTNIKSRVKSVNGFIEMQSNPNKGFVANIKLPI